MPLPSVSSSPRYSSSPPLYEVPEKVSPASFAVVDGQQSDALFLTQLSFLHIGFEFALVLIP